MLRKINNTDVAGYCKSHDAGVVAGVLQFLEWFDCGCDELRDAIRGIVNEQQEYKRLAAIEASRIIGESEGERKNKPCTKRKSGKVSEPATLKQVIDICQECGSKVVGVPLPGCEQKLSGRIFYAECSACTYYYEIFKNNRTGKTKKVEGGF